jgi:SulP family sulfate permease
MERVPAGFVEKWIAYARSGSTVNLYAIGVGLGALAIMLVWPRLTHRIPSPLVA